MRSRAGLPEKFTVAGSSGQICVTSFKDYLFRQFISVNVPPVEPHVAVVLDGQAAQQMTTDGVDSASETKGGIIRPSLIITVGIRLPDVSSSQMMIKMSHSLMVH